MKILNITRVAIATSVTGALVFAAIGFASGAKSTTQQPTTAAFTDPSTLPKFDHVLVVNATPEQIADLAKERAVSEYAVGQRAYVDADTKRLRPAFPEELAAEAAAAKSVPAQQASAPEVMANGATRVVLGESSMSYAVAHVEANGAVKEDCVTDQPSEKAVLSAAVAAPGVDKNEK
jgi:hypothetical protein